MKKIFLGFILTILISPVLLPVVQARGVTESIEHFEGEVDNVRSDVKKVKGAINDVSRTVKDVKGILNTGGQIMDGFADIFNTLSGAGGSTGGAVLPDGDFELPGLTEYNGMETDSLRTFILNVLNFALSFLGIVGVAAVIYGGYLSVVSGGDEANSEKAKKIIMYAVVGILIILASYAIVNTVIKEAATGGADRGGATGGTAASLNLGGGRLATGFAAGTTIPAGTVIAGVTITQDSKVAKDGSVSIPDNLLTDTNNLDLSNLLSFQNGIKVSGGDINDLGSSAIASEESAQNGIDFGLTVNANAIFDFGDGTQAILDTITSPGATISHSFGGGSSYAIRVLAQTVDGKVHTFEKTIVVGGTTANFSISRTEAVAGTSVTMNAISSRAIIGSIKGYNWSCSGTGNGCFPNANGQSITVSFGEAGTYDITLLVENALGTTDEITKTITILNDKPVAKFSYQSSGSAQNPLEFEFNGQSSQNIRGDSQGLMYEWSFDGDIKQTSSPTLAYRFSSEGNKTVTLEVSQQVNGRKLASEISTQTIDAQITLSPNFNINQ